MTTSSNDKYKGLVTVDFGQIVFLLDKISTSLEKIEKASGGARVMRPYVFNVSDTVTRIETNPHWINFDLINDGPDDINCWINMEDDPLLDDTTIAANGTLSIDFDYPLINRVYLKAEPGGSAVVRIFAVIDNTEGDKQDE